MEKQISAVDWIVDFFESGVSSVEEWTKAKEQANKMFEKQIIDAHLDGQSLVSCKDEYAEQYYNETFKSE